MYFQKKCRNITFAHVKKCSEKYMDTLLDILKYTIPAVIVLIATSIIVNKFLITETRKKQLAIFQDGLQTSLHLRLQAYERLTVFLERINPRAIIPRLYKPGMHVQEFRYVLINAIKQEFEHNLSQQIYVSNNVWNSVAGIKEQEMAMINQIASTLKPDSSAKELHQHILKYIVESEQEKLPITIGLNIIRNEAKLVLSQKA